MSEVKPATSLKYPELFSPIKIGPVEIKNRVAMAPTSIAASEPGGAGDKMIYFFAARAKGGTGLIFTGTAWIEPVITRVPRSAMNPWLYDKSHVPGWAALAEEIHAWGAKAFVQVDPGGPGTMGALWGDPNAMAPSVVEIKVDINQCVQPKAQKLWAKRGYDLAAFYDIKDKYPLTKEISVEQIHQVQDQIAHAFELAEYCGFDGAELHASHGNLGTNFLSPRTNLRTDAYGGSLENRTRYARECLEKARKKVSSKFAVGIRVSAAEHVPGGLTVEDTAEICKYLEPWLDFVDLSDGLFHQAHIYFLPEQDGTILDEAAVIKKQVKIPVITPSVHNPALANQAIKEGKTDMISLCRGLIADPEWANKAREGKPYVKCIKCLFGCVGRVDVGLPLRCDVNPNCLLEYKMSEYIRSNATHKRTFVIGQRPR